MTVSLTARSDRDVFALAFDEDQAPYTAGDEIERRFGADANDLLAQYFTASHASHQDMQRMASDETDLLVEIAKDTHEHAIAKDRAVPVCCCGHLLTQ